MGRPRPMTMTATDSPLLRMTQDTPTQYWNDSCAVEELRYAVERGATGATSNPSIVLEVMKKEKDHWVPRVREIAVEHQMRVLSVEARSDSVLATTHSRPFAMRKL